MLAHVKWFTEVTGGVPMPLRDLLQLPFFLALALTMLVALVLTLLDEPLQRLHWVQRIHTALERLRPYSAAIVRLGMAVPLVAAGLSRYLFHYELGPVLSWMGYAQIGLGVLLLLPGFAYRVGAAGVVALWLAGTARFGVHHLMDYVSWLGACYYLITHGTRLSKYAIPVLYITTGLSLTWGAVEKWVFPHMAIDILQRNPIPTFGFPMDLFLMLAGWVEFGVAYLLITGVLNRFLSLVVTLLFVTTSTVFGLKEVLGHWQLHATLIVFLAEGTGAYVTPVLWHKGKGLQLAFVGITLIPFLAMCIGLYYLLAPAH